jgi:hypothetical protein
MQQEDNLLTGMDIIESRSFAGTLSNEKCGGWRPLGRIISKRPLDPISGDDV